MSSIVEPPPFRVPPPPRPPRYDLWPVAMRSAARLHGALVPCGPGYRGVGWPETPTVRAAALAEFLVDGRIATHLTAAWVWGAARSPGHPLRVSTRGRRRITLPTTEHLRVAEARLAPQDVTSLGDFAATTPLRTMLDLLHDPEDFGPAELLACRLLSQRVPGGWAGVVEHLAAHRRPYRRSAERRVARIRAAPA